MLKVRLFSPQEGQATLCEPIIRSLPQWFGIEENTKHYISQTEELPTSIAFQEEHPIGFLTIKQHNQYSAEIYVMGVLPQFHRRGIGTRLIDRVESWSKKNGIEYLQVKTLGEDDLDPCYKKTREFYYSVGFKPLETFKQLWGDRSCLLLVKSLNSENPLKKFELEG